MKGIVFTEFLEMVEEVFSFDVAEDIIERANLPSGGAYTAVGTYDHNEIVQLVSELSLVTETPVSDLLQAFGKHLFSRFVVAYPRFFEGVLSAFDFLSGIEGHVHAEVLKLYPDAELPKFDIAFPQQGQLALTYHSSRPFPDLAEGLIAGCVEHFCEEIKVERTDLPGDEGGGVCFQLTSNASVPV